MLIVKVMGADDLPDADPRHSHFLICGAEYVGFERDPETQAAKLSVETNGEMETFEVFGNVYVMNEAGKTISSFSPNPVDEVACEPDGAKLTPQQVENARDGLKGSEPPPGRHQRVERPDMA